MRFKVLDTLCVLVENAGKLVTKQELLDAVWPEAVVEESNLTNAISVLRRALANAAAGEQYVQTVPRAGYRFAAAVELADKPATPPRAAQLLRAR